MLLPSFAEKVKSLVGGGGFIYSKGDVENVEKDIEYLSTIVVHALNFGYFDYKPSTSKHTIYMSLMCMFLVLSAIIRNTVEITEPDYARSQQVWGK